MILHLRLFKMGTTSVRTHVCRCGSSRSPLLQQRGIDLPCDLKRIVGIHDAGADSVT